MGLFLMKISGVKFPGLSLRVRVEKPERTSGGYLLYAWFLFMVMLPRLMGDVFIYLPVFSLFHLILQ